MPLSVEEQQLFTEIKTALPNFPALQKRLDDLEAIVRRPGGDNRPAEVKTVGHDVINSEEFKRFVKDGGRGRVYIKVGSLFSPETKTLIDSAAVGAAVPGVLRGERLPGIVQGARRALRIRDILLSRPTNSSSLEYMKEMSSRTQPARKAMEPRRLNRR